MQLTFRLNVNWKFQCFIYCKNTFGLKVNCTWSGPKFHYLYSFLPKIHNLFPIRRKKWFLELSVCENPFRFLANSSKEHDFFHHIIIVVTLPSLSQHYKIVCLWWPLSLNKKDQTSNTGWMAHFLVVRPFFPEKK